VAVLTGAIRQTYIVRDHKGNNARTSIWLQYSSVAADNVQMGQVYSQDLYAMQTGDTLLAHDGTTSVLKSKGPYTTPAQPYPRTFNSSGDYLTVEDKAVFVFASATGSLHRFQLAAPLASIFMADSVTVDTTQAVVKQFIADITATAFGGTNPNVLILRAACDQDSNILKSYVGGYRARRKMQRRFSIFTQNPALTGPGE
jgi:hypothetical protein